MIKVTQGDIKDMTGATGVDVSHALRHLPPVEKSGRWQYYDAAAALGVLESMLGFDSGQQTLMITLYIAMDSFGTACNVTGDGAIALIVNRLHKNGE